MAERSTRRQEKKDALFFIGRWAWIFLLGEAILLLSMLLFSYNNYLHPQAVACSVSMAIGVCTALLTRNLLSKHKLFVRILFPAIVMLICITGMNWLTAGQAGIGFQNDPLYGSPLLGLIPLGCGMLAIVLTLLAWSRKKKKSRRRSQATQTLSRRHAPAAERTETQPQTGSEPAELPSIITGRVAPIVRGSTGTDRPPEANRAKIKTKTAQIRRAKKKTRDSRLRLVGAEEHRCPYCLELVQPNDRRGVVICDVCHAYHHRDCWDVTGRCQVPHQSNSN